MSDQQSDKLDRLYLLLCDIEANAACGEPDWSGIENRIAQTKRWILSARSATDAIAKDAARYQWLAENAIIEFNNIRNDGRDPSSTKQPLDNAIDAAMGAVDRTAERS